MTRLASLSFLCALSLPFALVGCEATVVSDGEPSTGGNGGAGGSGGAGGAPSSAQGVPASVTAVARPVGDQVEFSLSNYELSCGDTSLPSCPAQESFRLDFDLPSSALSVGNVIALTPENSFFEQAGPNGGAPDCWSGGGATSGSVEIVSITASATTVKVNYPILGVQNQVWSVLDCGNTTSTYPAVAMTQFVYENGGSSHSSSVSVGTTVGSVVASVTSTGTTANVATTSVSGGTFDPDDLRIFIGENQAPTCTLPDFVSCTSAGWNASIRLPLAFQQVGSYPLAGLSNYFVVQGCHGGGGGGSLDGTIHVTAIHANSVEFSLSGTTELIFSGINLDGNYTAPRCF